MVAFLVVTDFFVPAFDFLAADFLAIDLTLLVATVFCCEDLASASLEPFTAFFTGSKSMFSTFFSLSLLCNSDSASAILDLARF